jgi:hypothetical protein
MSAARSVLLACLVCVVCSASGYAGDVPARQDLSLLATRAAGPIELDGVLDEPAWREAPVARDFVQREPRQGEPATEATEVRTLYDDDALYIGLTAYDRDPAGIIVNELRKDFDTGSADTFALVLDTFHDRRNAYMFTINAAGAKWDAQMIGEGREVNASWDGVWSVETRITGEGWFAEIVIPFRTLKFNGHPTQTWGVNFMRRIRRRNEESSWAPIPRIYELDRVSLAGRIEGFEGLRPGDTLRIKPYVLSSAADAAALPVEGDYDAGLDLKYAVTSSLTWDFTINTDFSQVEADEQQINLTRFDLLFPEKRDFFLENSGVFQFGSAASTGGGGGGGRQNAVPNDLILFFSRRIGLSDDARSIPIAGGTRLTGRSGPYIIGALNIQQQRGQGVPATNFTALRLRRDVLANSDVGVMLLNKEQSGSGYNRVVGADANFRFFQNLNVNAFAARTFSPAEIFAPGRPRAAPDGASATAARAGFSWRDSRWDVRAAVIGIGERFNDELGFVPRRGITKGEFQGGYRWRPAALSGWLRETFPHWQIVNVARHGRGLDSRYIDYHLPFTFQDGSFLEVGVNPSTEQLFVPFPINSRRGIVIAPGRYDFDEYFAVFNTNRSARLSFSGRYGTGEFYDGYRRAYSAGASARVNEHLTLSTNLGWNDVDLPAGAFKTTLVTSRVNFSFSTRMFLNALIQYNTDARQWSSNVRFNLIHRPLSDVFLVYNDRRDSRSGDLIDRALIAKMTYMVQF